MLRSKPDPFIDKFTGILLTPSPEGSNCLGNGEVDGYECCCDNCDFYLYCFPIENKKERV